MEYNKCKTCGASDGLCGLMIDNECLDCQKKASKEPRKLPNNGYIRLENWFSELENAQALVEQSEKLHSGINLCEYHICGIRRDILFRDAVPKLLQMVKRALEMSEILSNRSAFQDQFQRVLDENKDGT